MSAWSDPYRWSALDSGAGCRICLGGQSLDLITITEFEAESAAIAFMQTARQVSAALTIATRPVKMNVFQALSGSSCRQGAPSEVFVFGNRVFRKLDYSAVCSCISSIVRQTAIHSLSWRRNTHKSLPLARYRSAERS
jgi:hypothetical protein